jgi:hypothetical protein
MADASTTYMPMVRTVSLYVSSEETAEQHDIALTVRGGDWLLVLYSIDYSIRSHSEK